MNWVLLAELAYILLIIGVCLRIVFDTRSTSKASAYILLVLLIPVAGIFIYFSVGVNYRKKKLYTKNLFAEELKTEVVDYIRQNRDRIFTTYSTRIGKYTGLIDLMLNQNYSPLTDDNEIRLLINGEEKFPAVFEAIKKARHHIHLEYYIFDADHIGTQLIDLLIQKAADGVQVRFIFDDFGSRMMRRHLKRMRRAGIEVFPFYEIKFLFFANRLNYRNHRKIIVIDGKTAFVGGINVNDKYINGGPVQNRWYWRDTHLQISGSMVHSLQYIFMVDWNYCSRQKLYPDRNFFPLNQRISEGNVIGQVVASGPDSDAPFILHSLMKAISLAREEVLITNPYFIPNPNILDTILITALSGVKVKILVPGISDSRFVNIANHSYFTELLQAGVEIYTYHKGFVHAKTIIIDRDLAVVGTANMDFRSFDLNFEVNAMIYDRDTAEELRQQFYTDLDDASRVDEELWNQRPLHRQLLDRTVRLVSPLL